MDLLLIIPRAFLLAALEMIGLFLNFYFWVLIVAFGVINTDNRVVQTINDAINSLTEPLLAPIRRAIPPMGGFDLSPLVLIISILIFQRYFLPVLFVACLSLFGSFTPPEDVTVYLAGPVHIMMLLLDIYIWLIIIGAVIGWLVAAGAITRNNEFVNKINMFVSRITEPFLKPLRRRLAFIRGVDLSLLALIFLVMFVQHFLFHLVA
jgi:YggT family protein